MGRQREDGQIECLGREDDQRKIRGFRVEPGEIETALSHHAAVREAVVIAHEDPAQNTQLVAYYTSHKNPAVQASVLRKHLHRLLPDYMVPAAYVALHRLPLTANGKLDRRALPLPDSQAYARRPYEAPQGERETTLAQLWSELLG